MSFRDQEKRRLHSRKSLFLNPPACQPAVYGVRVYNFCIAPGHTAENLYSGIRQQALEYFTRRKIGWHHWRGEKTPPHLPSDHLCCSQCACVNAWFPLIDQPETLTVVLKAMGYPVRQMLPITADAPLVNGRQPYVAFEWIGTHNYLKELRRGRTVATDSERMRGAGFTSADFIFRFEREDGKIQAVLGEWKYTEFYNQGVSKQKSKSGTDRLQKIYRPALDDPKCQMRLNGFRTEDLFYDPFDQLMRLQLLASKMEQAHEMDADVVSILHVAPAGNTDLMKRITSPGLAKAGSDIHAVWMRLVQPDRFKGWHNEDLYPILCRHSPDPAWAEYLRNRYMSM